MSFLGLMREGRGTPYLIVGDQGRSRWALPADSARILRTAMSVHTPATPAAMTRWHLARLAAGTGLGRLLPGRWSRAEVPLAGALAQVLGMGDIRIGIAESFSGNRWVLIVMEPSGRIRAFAKVALSPEQIQSLERERENLRSLNGVRETVDVPETLYCGALDDHWALVLTPIQGRTGLSTWKLDGRRIDAAAAILGPQGERSELAERLPSNEPRDRGWARRVEGARSLLASRWGRSVPVGLSHGDFAPWNVFVRGSRVGVLDWEAADRRGLPFWDLWHFVVSGLHVAPAAITIRAIRGSLRERGPLTRSLRRYAHRTGVPVETARGVLVLYLTVSGLELLQEISQGRRDHAEALAHRERLLDEVLEVCG